MVNLESMKEHKEVHGMRKFLIYLFFIIVFIIIVIGFLAQLSEAYSPISFSGRAGEIISQNITLIPSGVFSLRVISPFQFYLSQSDFTNLDSNTTITISLYLDRTTPAGIYLGSKLAIFKREPNIKTLNFTYYDILTNTSIIITTNYTAENYSIEYVDLNVEVLTNSNFSVRAPTIHSESCKESVDFLEIENEGNVNLLLNFFTTSEIILLPNTTLLLPTNSKVSMPVFSKIPCEKSPGNYSELIIINNQTFYIPFSITDKTPPHLNITLEPNEKNYNLNTLIVACYDIVDNDEVEYSFIKFLDYEVNITKNKGCEKFVLNSPGEKEVMLYASDKSGNNASIVKKIFVNQANFSIVENVAFNRVRPNRDSVARLGIAKDKIPVAVKLYNVSIVKKELAENFSLIFKLVDDEKTLVLEENKEYNTTLSGNFYLTILSPYQLSGVGKLKLVFPQYVENREIEKTFAFEFGEYDVSKAWTGEIFNLPMSCEPNDVGVKELSKYVCKIEYPIDTKIEEVAVPCSKIIETNLKEKYELEKKTLQQSVDNLSLWRIFLIVVIIILIILLVYFTKIRGKIAIFSTMPGGG